MEEEQPTSQASAAGKLRQRRTRLYLIVMTVLYVISLGPALLAATMTPFAFDQGSSPEAWALVTKILAYPVVTVMAIAGMWLFYKLKLYWVAIGWSLLPVVNILLLFV